MKDLMDELGLSDDFDNIITMTDEDGNDVEMEWLDTLQYEGDIYVVLLPLDEAEEESEVVILQLAILDGDEDESFIPVEDEEKLDTLYALFKEKNRDSFDFTED